MRHTGRTGACSFGEAACPVVPLQCEEQDHVAAGTRISGARLTSRSQCLRTRPLPGTRARSRRRLSGVAITRSPRQPRMPVNFCVGRTVFASLELFPQIFDCWFLFFHKPCLVVLVFHFTATATTTTTASAVAHLYCTVASV